MIQLYAKGEKGFPEATIIYIPDGVDPTGLPVFIYLHGKGEHGDGSIASLKEYQANEGHLPCWLSKKDENGVFNGLKIGSEYYKPPFIICCPLTAKGVVLEGEQMLKYRTHIGTYFGTDSVAIGGISFGGKGTLKARVAYPDLFKAFLPMAPAYLAKENLPKCTAPMWSHHGAKDSAPGGVNPNWSVWNTEYSARTKGMLEQDIKEDTGINALNELGSIAEDLNYEWIPEIEMWEPIEDPVTFDAISIYVGKGHGIQYHTLHQKRVWDFLEHHLGVNNTTPPVEPERPLKNLSDNELLILNEYCTSIVEHSEELIINLFAEIKLRGSEVIKKYNL